ncbi:MAG: cell division protein ZapE [Brevirhabdus sp.]
MESLSDLYMREVEAGRLHADPAQQAALPELDRIRTNLEHGAGQRSVFGFRKAAPDIHGLYLWGGVGRGKSMLMDFFFSHVDIDRKRRVHFHAFMQEVHEALHEARKANVDDAIKPVGEKIARDIRLLCFDEMQITDITDAMIVGRLFEHIFRAGVVIVATSNRVPDDLYKDGLNRALFVPFIEMLKDRMVVHHLQSPHDYRQKKLAGESRYFVPADAAALSAIDTVWMDLTGGNCGPVSLPVKGHEVHIPLFHNGIARASFWDLCAQPYGPADYLALARHVRLLVLEAIPLMHRENYNEARRFVTLVDALYEARTRLIASADAQPESLYVEGEGVFEFERTASRLIEMQGQDWGADRPDSFD